MEESSGGEQATARKRWLGGIWAITSTKSSSKQEHFAPAGAGETTGHDWKSELEPAWTWKLKIMPKRVLRKWDSVVQATVELNASQAMKGGVGGGGGGGGGGATKGLKITAEVERHALGRFMGEGKDYEGGTELPSV